MSRRPKGLTARDDYSADPAGHSSAVTPQRKWGPTPPTVAVLATLWERKLGRTYVADCLLTSPSGLF